MNFREAIQTDIPGMHHVRISVKENALSNPSLITEAEYLEFITQRGKGWVCELDGNIAGFAIVDLQQHNIWALFVHPGSEAKGIGRKLHQTMMDWYFSETNATVWLSTAPRSRAERFYRTAGWREAGVYGKGEIRFEMTAEQWAERNNNKKETDFLCA